jgi:MFS family permease
MTWLKILHFLGLTNLSDEDVRAYEAKIRTAGTSSTGGWTGASTAVVMLAMFLVALNQSSLSTVLPAVSRDLGDFEHFSWIVNVYLITSAATTPLYSKLGHIYRRSTTMLAGVCLFISGSFVCAVAPNMAALVAGRAVQGLGGGGIIVLAPTIMFENVPLRDRGRYVGYFGLLWTMAALAGPVLGGLAAQHWHWSVVFWINVPLGLALALAGNRVLRDVPPSEGPHRLDLIGAALMLLSVSALLLAGTWGGTQYSWSSPAIISLLTLSFAFAVGFFWWLRRAREPFLSMAVLANPVARMSAMAASLATSASVGLMVFLPLYLELMHRLSPTETGEALVLQAILTTLGSMLTGRVMIRRRHYRLVPIAALSIACAALAVLIMNPETSLVGALILIGASNVAVGCAYPVATVSIHLALPVHEIGGGMEAVNFFRNIACALVVMVMGAIFLEWYRATPHGPVAHVFGLMFIVPGACLALALIGIFRSRESQFQRTARPRETTDMAFALPVALAL